MAGLPCLKWDLAFILHSSGVQWIANQLLDLFHKMKFIYPLRYLVDDDKLNLSDFYYTYYNLCL